MTTPDSVSDAAGADAAGKPRDVNYDLLRVVAMCLVIGVHVINNYMPVKMTLAGGAEVVRFVLFALFMVCNPLFIMVSGRFNLTFDVNKPSTDKSSSHGLKPYARYYYKRFISLIVPYLLYAGGMGFVAYLVVDHRSLGGLCPVHCSICFPGMTIPSTGSCSCLPASCWQRRSWL